MKQFLILLFTALLAVGCNSNIHQEKDLAGLNDVNKRGYFYTPSSFGFQPFNPDYSEVVRNAITDSLNLNATIVSSDNLKITSINTLQLSNDLSVDIHSKFIFSQNEYIDAMIDTLVFKESSVVNTTKTVRDISTNDYRTIANHISQSRANLFGLIERVSAPHIPLCHKPACSTHKRSRDAIDRAKKKDAENVKKGFQTKSNTFFDVLLPKGIDVNLLQTSIKEEFWNNLATNKAIVLGNLKDEFTLSVYEYEYDCSVSFKLVTRLQKKRIYSYITDIKKYSDDSVCASSDDTIKFYKDDIRERLLMNLRDQLSSSLTVELPADYEKYSRLIADYVQSGGCNPIDKINYETKIINVYGSETDRLISLTDYIANDLWRYSEPVCVTNFQIIGTTAYVEFDIHKNGFMGVSVWLGKIEPMVKRNLINNSQLLTDVIFDFSETI